METPGYSGNTILHSSVAEKAERAVFFLFSAQKKEDFGKKNRITSVIW
jgi:hypothetical protein